MYELDKPTPMERNKSNIDLGYPEKRGVGSWVNRAVTLCLAVMSLFCATWALFAFPLAGLGGLLLGYGAYRREPSTGSTCMILSGVALLVGLAVSFIWRLH